MQGPQYHNRGVDADLAEGILRSLHKRGGISVPQNVGSTRIRHRDFNRRPAHAGRTTATPATSVPATPYSPNLGNHDQQYDDDLAEAVMLSSNLGNDERQVTGEHIENPVPS